MSRVTKKRCVEWNETLGHYWPLHSSVTDHCEHLCPGCHFLQAGTCRGGLRRMFGGRYFFCLSLSARRSYSVSQAEEQSLLESRQKSRMIILQKPDAVIDGQQWVEAVRSHTVSVTVPHNHYGKVTPNHFNDVPILGQDDPDSRKLWYLFLQIEELSWQKWTAYEKNPS